MKSESMNLEEQLSKLPADVREAVLSVEWENKVGAIAARHKLHIDQQGALGDVTLLAMLGMLPLEQYPARIAEDLTVPAADAEVIAKEVSDEVFTSIRESLKRIHEPTSPAVPTPSAPAASASAPLPAPMKAPAPVAPAAPAFKTAPLVPTPAPAPEAPQPAQPKPELAIANAMLAATSVQTPAPSAPAPAAAQTAPIAAAPETKPAAYTTDPYREPPIP